MENGAIVAVVASAAANEKDLVSFISEKICSSECVYGTICDCILGEKRLLPYSLDDGTLYVEINEGPELLCGVHAVLDFHFSDIKPKEIKVAKLVDAKNWSYFKSNCKDLGKFENPIDRYHMLIWAKYIYVKDVLNLTNQTAELKDNIERPIFAHIRGPKNNKVDGKPNENITYVLNELDRFGVPHLKNEQMVAFWESTLPQELKDFIDTRNRERFSNYDLKTRVKGLVENAGSLR